jgi:hypothetical protein
VVLVVVLVVPAVLLDLAVQEHQVKEILVVAIIQAVVIMVLAVVVVQVQ